MKKFQQQNKYYLKEDSALFEKIVLATRGLASFLIEASNKGLEVKRVARCSLVLNSGGYLFKEQLKNKIMDLIISKQRHDGGWIDVEETVLSLKLLYMWGNHQKEIDEGNAWLITQCNPDSGWGLTERDLPRIPITGLFLYLLPDLSDQKAVTWLKNEWKKDFNSETRLTYKGAFFLMGLKSSGISPQNCPLINETYSFLENEQNNDGGFGPWKYHPIGSDPWSTGTVLLGLLAYSELTEKNVIEKAVNWLVENQLPNGLWTYHYIDEGSAYAYWGLIEALKYLKGRQI